MTNLSDATYFVGETAEPIPAPNQSKSELFLDVAPEDESSVSYKLEFQPSAPGGFLADTVTGAMLVSPERNGSYSVTLVATGPLGGEVEVSRQQFEVKKRPAFALNSSWDPDLSLDATHGYEATFDRDRTYELDGPLLSKESLFLSPTNENFQAITYAYSFKGCSASACAAPFALEGTEKQPGDFFVGSSGSALAMPTKNGFYVGELRARDEGGKTVVLKQWSFEVKERQAFAIHSISHNNGSIAGAEYILEPDNATTYSANKLYNFGPIDVNASDIRNAPGGSSSVTYTIEGAPPGFFIDPPTGEIQGSATAPGSFAMVIYGVDKSGAKAVAEAIEITLKYDDVAIPANGPNNETCMNGGTPEDATPFDQKFTCDCGSTQFGGDNCKDVRACDGGAFGSDNVCRRFQLVTEPRAANADAKNVRYINPAVDDGDGTKVWSGSCSGLPVVV